MQWLQRLLCCQKSIGGIKSQRTDYDDSEWMEPIILEPSINDKVLSILNAKKIGSTTKKEDTSTTTEKEDSSVTNNGDSSLRRAQRRSNTELWTKIRSSVVTQKKANDAWLAWDLVVLNLDKLKIEDIELDDGRFDAAVVKSFNTIDYDDLRRRDSSLYTVDIDIGDVDLHGADDDAYLVASLSSHAVHDTTTPSDDNGNDDQRQYTIRWLDEEMEKERKKKKESKDNIKGQHQTTAKVPGSSRMKLKNEISKSLGGQQQISVKIPGWGVEQNDYDDEMVRFTPLGDFTNEKNSKPYRRPSPDSVAGFQDKREQ